MRRTKIAGKALLQVAALSLFLNAMSAYGACGMQAQAADDASEARMPCHGSDREAMTDLPASDIDVENCCSACVPVAIFTSIDAGSPLRAESVRIRSTTLQASSGFDPPFRPPIAVLS